MKLLIKHLLILSLIVPSIIYANDFEGRYTREKKLSKSYNVNSDAKLQVENKYGNIEISPWDRDEISIEVVIRVTGNSESKVEDKLDDIDIEFSGNKSLVYAKTHIESSNSWFNWFNTNVNYKINYYIHVPITSKLDIKNKYGDTFIEESKGEVILTHDYGKIVLGTLLNERNEIDMDYSNLEADYIKNAGISLDYSDFSVGELESFTLNADYSHIDLGKAIKGSYDLDYGGLSIEAINILEGDSDYTDIRVDLLGKAANLSADYGKITIGLVSDALESLTIDTDYTGIKIGYAESSNFNFEINSKYTDVEGINDDLFNLDYRNEKSSSKHLKGSFGRSATDHSININSSYGHIKFRKKFN